MTHAYDQAHTLAAFLTAVLLAVPVAAQPPAPGFADPLLGRWDLTVQGADGAYPSWLEVRLRTEGELMGRFVGRVGSARYVSDISFVGERLTFNVPAQYESRVDELRFEGTLRGERMAGPLAPTRVCYFSGSSDVRYAARFKMSSAPKLVTTGVISGVHAPRRLPVFMSASCRAM